MGEARFDLVFEGEFMEGFEPQQVRERFAQVFKLPEEKLERVFAGSRVVLRRKLSEANAQRFHEFLTKIGMKVQLLALPAAPGGALPTADAETTADAPAADDDALPFEFHGRGSEYFKIWIVNIFLTILTLGIYSAWAKVRNNRYFYGNTRVADSSFEYVAAPVTILKGRLLAMGCFVLYMVAEAFIPWLALILLALFMLALPWVVTRSLAFNARNSAYRNVRFDFHGTTNQAYKAFLGWPLLGMVTLGLLYPFAYYKQQRFIVANSAFGQQRFDFEAGPKPYYLMALAGIGILIGGLIAVTLVSGLLAWIPAVGVVLMPLGMLFAYLMAGAYLYTRATNLRLNGAVLGAHRLRSEMTVGGFAWIWSSNAVATILTLGLFYPWARVRMAAYRARCTSLLAGGDLGEFATAEQHKVSAAGQEIGDVFDLGVGI